MRIVIVLIMVCQASALDQHWVDSVAGQNCSSFLHTPLLSHFPDKKYESQISDYYSPSNGCPPWYHHSSNQCIFGDNLDRVLKDDTYLMQTSIQHFYCMTVSNTTGTSVVGRLVPIMLLKLPNILFLYARKTYLLFP